MLYCKNCGRQLKDGMRFCDRCGQSVRKTKESTQAAKRREIEELKAERLNRKKRLAEKEAKQARKKQRKKSGGGIFIFIIIVILIAIVSVIIGFRLFSGGSGSTSNEGTEASMAISTELPSAETSASSGTYSEITVGNIAIPYPASFYSNTVSGNEKLNLTDSLGGAQMIVAQEAKSGDTKDLIKDYISEIGANDNPEMHAGGDWYSVTAAVGDKIYHRKCIVRNGLSVYYDFTYEASSTVSKKYEEYIKYIDSKFS